MNETPPDVDDLIRRVDRARGYLQNGFRKCQMVLRENVKNAPNDSLDWMLQAGQRQKVLNHVFNAMGDSLRKAFAEFEDNQSVNSTAQHLIPNDFQFYMWPGYDFISVPGKAYSRSSLVCDYGSKEISCGYGSNLKEKIVQLDLTAVWFSKILEQQEEGSFIPGSTHEWIVEVTEHEKGKAGDPEKLDHLTFLEIGSEKTLTVAPAQAPKKDYYFYAGQSIELKTAAGTDDWVEWSNTIGNHLNCQKFEVDWPAPATRLDSDPSKAEQEIRRRLYSVWLAIAIGYKDTDQFRSQFVELLSSTKRFLNAQIGISGLGELIKQLKSESCLETEQLRKVPYQIWYSLPLDPTINVTGKLESLGSFMLLTTHRVERPILYMISSWVHKIYSELRLTESLAEVRRAETKSNQQQFAHMIQGQINLIYGGLKTADEGINKLAAQAALRQLQFSVNVWDDRPFVRLDKSTKIDWEQCIDDACHLAVARFNSRLATRDTGEHKCLDAYYKSGQHNEEYEKLCKRISDNIYDSWSDRPTTLRTFLRFEEESLDCFSTKWDGHVAMGLLTYLLAQSLFHGAVFATRQEILCSQQSDRTVELKYCQSSSRIVLRNRAIEVSTDFSDGADDLTLQQITKRIQESESSTDVDVIEHKYQTDEGQTWFTFTINGL